MATPESQEMQMRVDELIRATRKGSLQWKPVNPTTYLWEKMDPAQMATGARLTLQRVEGNIVQAVGAAGRQIGVRQSFYILQVVELKLGSQLQRLTISGSGDPQLNVKLQELFQLVSSGASQQGMEFLKSIIPQD
jgi:hypothetical protein